MVRGGAEGQRCGAEVLRGPPSDPPSVGRGGQALWGVAGGAEDGDGAEERRLEGGEMEQEVREGQEGLEDSLEANDCAAKPPARDPKTGHPRSRSPPALCMRITTDERRTGMEATAGRSHEGTHCTRSRSSTAHACAGEGTDRGQHIRPEQLRSHAPVVAHYPYSHSSGTSNRVKVRQFPWPYPIERQTSEAGLGLVTQRVARPLPTSPPGMVAEPPCCEPPQGGEVAATTPAPPEVWGGENLAR